MAYVFRKDFYAKQLSCVLVKRTDATKYGLDLTGKTVKFRMWSCSAGTVTNKIAATTTGVAIQPTKTFTFDVTNDWLYSVDHGIVNGDEIILTTSGTLGAGFATSTRYFARDVSGHKFRLGLSPSAAAIEVTTAGSGTHSFAIIGNASYTWQSGDLDTIGSYRGEWQIGDGTDFEIIPANESGSGGFAISVIGDGCS